MSEHFKIEPILKLVDARPAEVFYSDIENALSHEEKRFVITLNPEMLMSAAQNMDMNNVLTSNENDIIPDGIGIVFALRKLKKGLMITRNAGIDLVEHLLGYSHTNELSLFVYGTTQQNLASFDEVLKKRFDGIKNIVLCNGFQEDESTIRKDILTMKPDILLVALGTPKQELFIASLYPHLDKGICIGVGGSIDVLGGAAKRAPHVLRIANLEWLYRIIREPQRLKRFFTGNIKYVAALFKEGLV